MGDEISRIRENSNVMNVLCIGGSYWLQIIFKKEQAINPIDVHSHFVREVILPAYKSSTNNATLLSTVLLCTDKRILIESSSCRQFFTQVKDILHGYFKISLLSFALKHLS